jgi:prepilin-type N-terminal cleavage/methylation domain-containing protein
MTKKMRSGGFSLVELMIVVTIILLISAIAFPKIQGAIEGLKLRATVTDINGLIQQLRIQSVRANRSYTMRTAAATAGNGITLYVDTNNNNAVDAGEAQIQLPIDTNLSNGAGAPGVLPPNVVIPPYIVGNPTTMSFNERGLPCSNPPTCNTVAPFLIYFAQTRPSGTPGWGAITITQAGRIKAYTYTGGAAGTWQ